MLNASRRGALKPPPLPDGHLALLAVLRHGLDLRANVRHLLLLRLLLAIELRRRWAVETAQLTVDSGELLAEEELLLLLGEALVDRLRYLLAHLGDRRLLDEDRGRALEAVVRPRR